MWAFILEHKVYINSGSRDQLWVNLLVHLLVNLFALYRKSHEQYKNHTCTVAVLKLLKTSSPAVLHCEMQATINPIKPCSSAIDKTASCLSVCNISNTHTRVKFCIIIICKLHAYSADNCITVCICLPFKFDAIAIYWFSDEHVMR